MELHGTFKSWSLQVHTHTCLGIRIDSDWGLRFCLIWKNIISGSGGGWLWGGSQPSTASRCFWVHRLKRLFAFKASCRLPRPYPPSYFPSYCCCWITTISLSLSSLSLITDCEPCKAQVQRRCWVYSRLWLFCSQATQRSWIPPH